jgi:hypothetical protein
VKFFADLLILTSAAAPSLLRKSSNVDAREADIELARILPSPALYP